LGGVGAIGFWAIKSSIGEWLSLTQAPLYEALVSGMQRVAVTCFSIVLALLLVVLIDVPWQLWSHYKKLRMSREDVKQEHKESEGDPMLKGKIRQMQRAAARRRMMAAVPTADVVVTNPQHYAVALSYKADSWQAPRVVAKGAGAVAARIRELAQENKVPLVRVPPLARALHHHVEIDHEVPAALYQAVAQLLVWAYQLRDGAKAGPGAAVSPQDIQIPPQWDPDEKSPS
jgi:flagellar biosynthetic protein FlhB